MTDLSLRCRCRRVHLRITNPSPATANRIRCACEGCQNYARRLAPDILDEHGGTERFQVDPASLTIQSGRDAIACLQQTPKGALRWYAACCNTPLALTLRYARVPFVGLDAHTIDLSELDDDTALEDVLGPVRAYLNLRLAHRDQARALLADGRSLRKMLRHLTPLTLRWWWRGAARQSPFFSDGAPIVDVERLYDTLPARAARSGCR